MFMRPYHYCNYPYLIDFFFTKLSKNSFFFNSNLQDFGNKIYGSSNICGETQWTRINENKYTKRGYIFFRFKHINKTTFRVTLTISGKIILI